MNDLSRTVEALLFLSPDPVSVADLSEATEATEGQVAEAIELLSEDLAEGKRGIVLRLVGGGFTLASEPAARLPRGMPPRKATMKMLMTRPRISSGAMSCASETSVDVRMTTATPPMNSSRKSSQSTVGTAPIMVPANASPKPSWPVRLV